MSEIYTQPSELNPTVVGYEATAFEYAKNSPYRSTHYGYYGPHDNVFASVAPTVYETTDGFGINYQRGFDYPYGYVETTETTTTIDGATVGSYVGLYAIKQWGPLGDTAITQQESDGSTTLETAPEGQTWVEYLALKAVQNPIVGDLNGQPYDQTNCLTYAGSNDFRANYPVIAFADAVQDTAVGETTIVDTFSFGLTNLAKPNATKRFTISRMDERHLTPADVVSLQINGTTFDSTEVVEYAGSIVYDVTSVTDTTFAPVTTVTESETFIDTTVTYYKVSAVVALNIAEANAPKLKCELQIVENEAIQALETTYIESIVADAVAQVK